MPDAVYVIGSLNAENREVVYIPNGETTDLPAGAVFTYNSNFTTFPYKA